MMNTGPGPAGIAFGSTPQNAGTLVEWETPTPAPTTGRIVRYVNNEGGHGHHGAHVSMAEDTWVQAGDTPALDSPFHVHLWVFAVGHDGGGFEQLNVAYDETGAPGTWHWTPRT